MTTKISIWFFAGVIVFSMGLGLIIGASNSPVVGVAITGLFGLMVSLYSLVPKKENSSKAAFFNDLAFVGKSLILFSIGMLAGVFAGCQYRLFTAEQKNEKLFIWNGSKAPTSTYEALDWIAVTEILLSKGYSEKQISDLYKLRTKEIKDTANTDAEIDAQYSRTSPYFKMLLTPSAQEKKGRGPASLGSE